MSERGPKGDHGQHGDLGPTGLTGATGERGAHGLEGDAGERGATGDVGQSGETGQRGIRGPSHWIAYVVMGVAMFAAGIVFLQQDNAHKRDAAETALSNCEQIELVKGEIRATVQSSLRRLPTIEYYQQRPDELADAIVETKRSIARFAERNCYALPAVKDAGLKRP